MTENRLLLNNTANAAKEHGKFHTHYKIFGSNWKKVRLKTPTTSKFNVYIHCNATETLLSYTKLALVTPNFKQKLYISLQFYYNIMRLTSLVL